MTILSKTVGYLSYRSLVISIILIASTLAVNAVWAVIRPNVLWLTVHDLCVRDMVMRHHPFPCTRVDLARGYAIVEVLGAQTHLLLVPTRRISGLEDAQLLRYETPNYWQDAWDARHLIESKLGRPLPRDFIGLAINSKRGRTQNQLHIHVDCIRPDVLLALRAHDGEIGAAWTDLSFHLLHHEYRARRLDEEELNRENPFSLLSRGDIVAKRDMANETLAVLATTSSNGRESFILLSRHADPSNGYRGFSEELLDHKCRVQQLSS